MKTVKIMKSSTSQHLSCNKYDTMLAGDSIMFLVKAVEQNLNIESSEQINDNLTNEELKTAGEMFLFLSTCPDSWFKSWSSFYTDLFLTESTDQIILTLNRLIKTEMLQDKEAKVRAEKLMKRSMSLMSLKYEQIQRWRPEKNGYVFKDSEIRNGTNLSDII